MKTLLDTRPDKDLCDYCGSRIEINCAYRNDDFEIFLYKCSQCNKKFCLLMKHELS